MGEVADMMLDGTLCEGCGVYMGSAGDGFPRHCQDCRPHRTPKVRCPTCRKFVHPDGMPAHTNAKHPEKNDNA